LDFQKVAVTIYLLAVSQLSTSKLVNAVLKRIDRFALVDIGCAEGVDPNWRQFEPKLEVRGFDPLIHEIQRLSAEEQNSKIHYEAAFVRCKDYHELTAELAKAQSDDWFGQTSAAAACSPTDYARAKHNAGAPLEYADREITLDKACAEFAPDFIKIDTDGSDYFVLRDARHTLDSALGLLVECPFHGARSDDAHLFRNVDRLLHQAGFSIFDLNLVRYSRAALPARFQFRLFAQTITGQISWANALYLRSEPNGEQQRLKLAVLAEMFGFPDRAAELLAGEESLLNLLVPVSDNFGASSYREYIDAFKRDPANFFPVEPSQSSATVPRDRLQPSPPETFLTRILAHFRRKP
jgi:FkbM family methyltransferase